MSLIGQVESGLQIKASTAAIHEFTAAGHNAYPGFAPRQHRTLIYLKVTGEKRAVSSAGIFPLVSP